MTTPDTDQLSPFTVAELRRGFVAALPFLLSNGTAGAVMGLTDKGLGLNFAQSVAFSAVVYSATAQAIAVSLWKVPLPVLAMVVACAATNARYLIMSFLGASWSMLIGGGCGTLVSALRGDDA
jgi:predicted branched-subunit amino acid permease